MANAKKQDEVQRENRDGGKQSRNRIRSRTRGHVATADWASCPAELLSRVISAVTRRQCAIQFGYTRDGGNYSIRIVGDGEPYNEYPEGVQAIEQLLVSLCDDFEA